MIVMTQISIIIPTFNSEGTVRKALDSVLGQTFQNWECIVVDGVSKDNTLDIVEEFCQKDSRFRYVSERDYGIYDAFNKGWKMAKSEWIMYLGSDDYYFDKGLENLMSRAKDNVDIVYGDCELRFKQSRRIRGNTPMSSIGYQLPACHQSMAMRRSLFEKLGGFDLKYKVYGDLDIIQRGYVAGAQFAETDAVISSFHVGGVSTDNLAATRELYTILKTNGIVKYPRLKILQMIFHTVLMKAYHLFK